MRNALSGIAAGLLCVMVVSPALGDWDRTDPAKWVQLPDRTPLGMDVWATYPWPFGTTGTAPIGKVLADDFLCTLTGPITDVHIWGSWLHDQLPANGPGSVPVKLSIHADIPDPDGTGPLYSQPGAQLWSTVFNPGTYQVRPDGTGPESFYDPNAGQVIGTDQVMWQYNFLIPDHQAFVQQVGTVYWLDVQVFSLDAFFGWKTRDPQDGHFNDDAVWADTAVFTGPPVTPWGELRYPLGHPYEGRSMDLAFVLTTTAIPLPAALPAGAALLAGVLGLGWLRRRRRVEH
jgi:uncharacterized protein (TIGR03382 family)